MTTRKPEVVCHAVKAVGAPVTLKFIVREDAADEYMNTLSERHPVVSSSPPIHLSAYEALQAELADMERDYLVTIEAQDAEHRKQLARLQAECEQLRKDAGRYRWLRGRDNFPLDEGDGESLWDQLCEIECDEFDAFIDAVMAREAQQ